MLPSAKKTYTNKNFANDGKILKLFLTDGVHQVRFMENLSKVHISYDHWVKRGNYTGLINCFETDENSRFHKVDAEGNYIGEPCPICERNRKILSECDNNFKEARNHGLANAYPNFHINVLDLTLVKVHPNSSKGIENKPVNGVWTATDYKEKHLMLDEVTPAPSGKIKILSGSETFFTSIQDMWKATGEFVQNSEEGYCLACNAYDASGNHDTNCPTCGELLKYAGFTIPMDITTYNYAITVNRSNNGKKVLTPTPLPNTVSEIGGDYELYDLDKIATMQLDASEMRELLSGVALGDIFAGRTGESTDKPSKMVSSAEVESVNKVANELEESVLDILNS